MKKPRSTPQSDLIEQYHNICNSVASFFANKYFGPHTSYHWIADDIGGVCEINESFFNVIEMIEYMKYKYTPKQMFDYHERAQQAYEDKTFIVNIKHWKKKLRK